MTSCTVVWEGSMFVHHSLAMVNREFVVRLVHNKDFLVSVIPYEVDQFSPSEYYRCIKDCYATTLPPSGIYIRHKWPPSFDRIPNFIHILFQPWEFGTIPISWVQSIATSVDEVWTSSQYCKQGFIDSGIPLDKVHVVPLGIDPLVFRPQAPPLTWLKQQIGNRFSFFFNGGVNFRKGTDILVNAYENEFGPHENVCLVIKDSTFYQSEMSRQIEMISRRSDIAKIIYFRKNLELNELPGLYTACNCYVQCYRGEGFGLPIAEAMACGLPTIVTGAGACLDFTRADLVYYIPSTLQYTTEKKIQDIETVHYPQLHIPDGTYLQKLMRFVFENYELAKKKGLDASSYITSNHTWDTGNTWITQRLRSLSTFTQNNR